MQYQSSCAPKLATKCEIEHLLPCGADGQAGGVLSRDYQIFWDGYIYLAMRLRSRALPMRGAPLLLQSKQKTKQLHRDFVEHNFSLSKVVPTFRNSNAFADAIV